MSPFAISGLVFLGAIAYALIGVAVYAYSDRRAGGSGKLEDPIFLFWPVIVVVSFVWLLLLKPWGGAFRWAIKHAGELGDRHRKNESAQ